MKTFIKAGAQGDLYWMKVPALPDRVVADKAERGHVIVGHSETGHHHVMDARWTTMYRLPEELYECFLVVTEVDELQHLRSFDTHETWQFQPGIYRVRRQREYVPEGWRRAVD